MSALQLRRLPSFSVVPGLDYEEDGDLPPGPEDDEPG
jgi:hypothetical protein